MGELVLIVIDPISLYDDIVYNRLSTLRTHLQNNPTATSVLAPFPIPKPIYYLRKLIETGLADLWKQFFDPVFGEDSRATALEICAMGDLDTEAAFARGVVTANRGMLYFGFPPWARSSVG